MSWFRQKPETPALTLPFDVERLPSVFRLVERAATGASKMRPDPLDDEMPILQSKMFAFYQTGFPAALEASGASIEAFVRFSTFRWFYSDLAPGVSKFTRGAIERQNPSALQVCALAEQDGKEVWDALIKDHAIPDIIFTNMRLLIRTIEDFEPIETDWFK